MADPPARALVGLHPPSQQHELASVEESIFETSLSTLPVSHVFAALQWRDERAIGEWRFGTYLCLGRTWSTSLQLAVGTFINERVWTRVAHIAVPDDDGRIRLDDLEGVLAVYWGGHCDRWVQLSERCVCVGKREMKL